MAADEVKNAPPLVCPNCDWSGFYIGGNVGGSFGWNRTQDSVSLFPPGVPGVLSPGVINPVSSVDDTRSPAGVLGGGQIGFNWQLGSWVLGFEADGNGTSQHDRLDARSFLASTVVVAPASLIYSDEQNIKWLATARARLGWSHDYWLWYVTGGAAWGDVESNYTFQASGSPVFATLPLTTANFSTTKAGRTVGGGAETSLAWISSRAKNLSLKLEYLYVDLGTVNNSFSVPLVATPTSSYTFTSSSRITDHIIRAGVNYRFYGF